MADMMIFSHNGFLWVTADFKIALFYMHTKWVLHEFL